MKNFFKKASQKVPAPPLSEAEQALQSWGVAYNKEPDGTIVVPWDLDISRKGLYELPDLSKVVVKGNFNCAYNVLASLKGAPQSVGGNYNCAGNMLESLEHAPQTIHGNFKCSNNTLVSLEHAPKTVSQGFYCASNRLTSLKGAPQTLNGDFSCAKNNLTSLEGAPQTVREIFYCQNNKLSSLRHAPEGWRTLWSDLGNFTSQSDIPQGLQSPQPADVQNASRKEAVDQAAQNVAVVENGAVIRPMRIKLKPPVQKI